MKENAVELATQSVCPECLAVIPAVKVARGDSIVLQKTCPEHGRFEAVVWRGNPPYLSWQQPKIPSHPAAPFTQAVQGCPWDCGLCPEHRQHTCTALLEVTGRCDLRCPFCFAVGGETAAADPDLTTIKGWFQRLLDAGGPYNIQLSGGEPTVRNDLPEIIALGRSLGFHFIQLNSNGLRLGRDPDFAAALKAAGLASVFLQFDGVDDAVYTAIRGRALWADKQRAVEACAENDLGVILVPTLVPGINVHQIGAVIDFAVQHIPVVRGVHFQPVSYFGRYPSRPAPVNAADMGGGHVQFAPRGGIKGGVALRDLTSDTPLALLKGGIALFEPTTLSVPLDRGIAPMESTVPAPRDCQRITIPDVLREIETQTGGGIRVESFKPPGCENAFCSFHGNFMLMPDGKLQSWTRHDAARGCCTPTSAEEGAVKAQRFVTQFWTLPAGEPAKPAGGRRLGDWEVLLERCRSHSLCISGMAFQDAWTLDLDRLRDCCIHVVHPDGRLIPFCAFNLTSREGRSLYRPGPCR